MSDPIHLVSEPEYLVTVNDPGTVYVWYSIDDDGIHLACKECDWTDLLDFNPSLYAIVRVAIPHEATHMPTECWCGRPESEHHPGTFGQPARSD